MSQRITAAGLAITGVDPFPGVGARAVEAGIAAVAEAPADGTVIVMVATPDQLDVPAVR